MTAASLTVEGRSTRRTMLIGNTTVPHLPRLRHITVVTGSPPGSRLSAPTAKEAVVRAVHDHGRSGSPALIGLEVFAGPPGSTWCDGGRHVLCSIKHRERQRHSAAVGMTRDIDSVLIDAPLLRNRPRNRAKLFDGRNAERPVIGVHHHEPGAGCRRSEAGEPLRCPTVLAGQGIDHQQMMRTRGVVIGRCTHVKTDTVARDFVVVCTGATLARSVLAMPRCGST